MRCVRCGRWGRRLRAGRGPEGRLVFNWCHNCLAEAHMRALGLVPTVELPTPTVAKRQTLTFSKKSKSLPIIPGEPGREERNLGLRSLGVLLVVWGLLLELIGAAWWYGFGPPDDGFGPTRIKRMQLFLVAGAFLAILGAWVGLSTLDRGARRRTLGRAVEASAVGLGLCVLAVGVVFHERSRDPWVFGGVVLAVLAARAARVWSRAHGSHARPLPS